MRQTFEIARPWLTRDSYLLSSHLAGKGGTSGKRQHKASALGRAVVMSTLTKDHVHGCTQGRCFIQAVLRTAGRRQ